MKKNTLFTVRVIACLLVLAQLLILTVFGTEASTVKEYELLESTEPILLDGEITEYTWFLQPWETLSHYDGSHATGSFSAKFKAVWSKTHLYFLVEVTDFKVDSSGAEWNNDIVRLFVEESGDGTGTTANGGYAKSANMAASSAGVLYSKAPYTYCIKLTDTGYRVEASYQFSDTSHAVKDHSIRMEIHAVDHTVNGATYNEQHYWSSTKAAGKADSSAALAGRGLLAENLVGDPRPKMADGAGVRLREPTGLRFESRISKVAYDALEAQGATLTVGTVIFPAEYKLPSGDSLPESLPEDRYLNVINNGWANTATAETDGYYQFFGSIVDIKTQNLQRRFSAVSYLKIEKGGTIEMLYSLHNSEQHARSVAEVAIRAANSGEYEPEKSLLKSFYTVRINGMSLAEYRIVYPEGNAVARANAEVVQAAIKKCIDQELPIVSDSSGVEAKEILVGITNRTESQGMSLAPMEYTYAVSNGKLLVMSCDVFSEERFIGSFEGELCRYGGDLSNMKVKNTLVENIPAAAPDAYRFMQYNILVEYEGWGSGGIIKPELSYRQEPVTGLLLKYAPDVAVLCEVFPGWRAFLPELLGDEYAFAEIDLVNTPSTVLQSNRTPIIYKKDKFDLVESGYRDIGIRSESGREERINYRVVTWAVLQDKSNGQRIAVFGTHWEANQHVPTSTPDAKLNQAKWMSEEIARITARYENIPVIAMGDLNSRSYSAEVEQLLRDSELTHFFAGEAWDKIDHIAYRGGALAARGIESGNYAEYASDHKPIWCDLKFE